MIVCVKKAFFKTELSSFALNVIILAKHAKRPKIIATLAHKRTLEK